jgi:hypothetical protein
MHAGSRVFVHIRMPSLHASIVHGSMSAQFTGVPATHASSVLHVSAPLQKIRSSHSAALRHELAMMQPIVVLHVRPPVHREFCGTCSHVPATVHVSSVQSTMSLQSAGVMHRPELVPHPLVGLHR